MYNILSRLFDTYTDHRGTDPYMCLLAVIISLTKNNNTNNAENNTD